MLERKTQKFSLLTENKFEVSIILSNYLINKYDKSFKKISIPNNCFFELIGSDLVGKNPKDKDIKNKIVLDKQNFYFVVDPFYVSNRNTLPKINFLGQPAYTILSTAKLVLLKKVIIQPFLIRYNFECPNNLELIFTRNIDSIEYYNKYQNRNERIIKIMEKVNDVLGEQILRYPEQWHWWEDLERRWGN